MPGEEWLEEVMIGGSDENGDGDSAGEQSLGEVE